MSRFNQRTTRPAASGPIVTATTPSGTTHEGRAGYARDPKGELFLLAVANMVGKDTFYEKAGQRDERYEKLIHEVAIADPDWTLRFLRWLRTEANMRTASLVGAAEAVWSRLLAAAALQAHPTMEIGDGASNRQIIDAVLQRADEPGELLAYWTSQHGRSVPKPVKRGIADAVARLYTQRSLLKYDTDSHGYRFGDVIDLVHPTPAADKPWQGALFRYALDRRHGRDVEVATALQTIIRNGVLRWMVANGDLDVLLDADALAKAGMTWEDALSLAGDRVDKARLWEALIPSMGYMALLRNLRNFDQAGVSDEVAEKVAARLADPAEVASSRQFPFRFYAAHTAVSSLRWGHALEKALAASLSNVPALPGRTLVLVDQSPSMFPGFWGSSAPARSDISNADLAKLFGSAVALRAADATLVGYGHRNYRVPTARGEAVLRLMGKFRQEDGTDAYGAAHDHFDGHDRIVVVTDGENNGHRFGSYEAAGVPRGVPIYTWNIGGYRLSQDPGAPNRHTFAGLTDAAFRMIPLLEAHKNATWPF